MVTPWPASPLTVLGMMSGTSLDGLDLAMAGFSHVNSALQWELLETQTVDYPGPLSTKLQEAIHAEKNVLEALDDEMGGFFGRTAKAFISATGRRPDLIASHGHTIFHQPENGLTLQVGNGKRIATLTGLPVVYDFRSEDVSKGGQGAPLVPAGEKEMFPEFDCFLNLGGIANVSFRKGTIMQACDVCPCNLVLNELAGRTGKQFDVNGELSRSGKLNMNLLDTLNALTFYDQEMPKSLGKEWVSSVFMNTVDKYDLPVADALRTIVEHIAIQVSAHIARYSSPVRFLVTGGGAHHTYLVERLKNNCVSQPVIPGRELIEFKEALIFAYLGYLRITGQPNVLSSVTGATSDSCAGRIATP